MGRKTGAFLDKGSLNRFLLLDSRFLIKQQLKYKNGRDAFSTWSVPGWYN
jgi:hypothetical protein